MSERTISKREYVSWISGLPVFPCDVTMANIGSQQQWPISVEETVDVPLPAEDRGLAILKSGIVSPKNMRAVLCAAFGRVIVPMIEMISPNGSALLRATMNRLLTFEANCSDHYIYGGGVYTDADIKSAPKTLISVRGINIRELAEISNKLIGMSLSDIPGMLKEIALVACISAGIYGVELESTPTGSPHAWWYDHAEKYGLDPSRHSGPQQQHMAQIQDHEWLRTVELLKSQFEASWWDCKNAKM